MYEYGLSIQVTESIHHRKQGTNLRNITQAK